MICQKCNNKSVLNSCLGKDFYYCRNCKEEVFDKIVNSTTLHLSHLILGSFVSIPSGTFQMGSPESEISRCSDETQHLVTLTKSFEMQTTQVTQKQWTEVMGNNPSYFNGDNLPVERVSWNDCQEFIQKLNSANDGYAYRLPTEAEWEYCCRAGAASAYSFGDDTDQTGDYAWYYPNSFNRTHEVAQLKPNAFGLYDLHGNVWEWCQDWYGGYNSQPITDPTGPNSGFYRVAHGGGWADFAQCCRSAVRDFGGPGNRYSNVGFRLVRTKA